jgi:hypothetical protein
MAVGRTIGGWIGTGLLALLLVRADASFAQGSSGETHVEVTSSAGWTDTGIEVAPGDTLAIRASSRSEQWPPGGYANLAPSDAAPDLPGGALIGRVGNEPPFLVGSRLERKVETGGRLELRWNLRQAPRQAAAFSIDIVRTPAPLLDEDHTGNVQAPPDNAAAADGNLEVGGGAGPAGNDAAVEEAGNGEDVVAAQPEPAKADAAAGNSVGDSPRPKQRAGLPAPFLWSAGVLALAMIAAGAGLSVRQSRRRRIARTIRLLGIVPSLDLGAGECRGGDVPDEGPAARFATRLEVGAIRWRGGEDG